MDETTATGHRHCSEAHSHSLTAAIAASRHDWKDSLLVVEVEIRQTRSEVELPSVGDNGHSESGLQRL